ncbi:hypothetical protein NDU88_012432 [Pleurodeles waltl]|uniref:Uncharacterized protein n=1 Tax=Pleurodeles waltl TaxID=8319 RepID=A0AAV7R030_PLEWA|nr:hypothetical protein NDU88_012432 [Pleurodeles waltl]
MAANLLGSHKLFLGSRLPGSGTDWDANASGFRNQDRVDEGDREREETHAPRLRAGPRPTGLVSAELQDRIVAASWREQGCRLSRVRLQAA